jgi:hypothetical protein
VDARDVPGHVDLEPFEKHRQRAVQVVAVAAATGEDALDGGEWVDGGWGTAEDVDVLPHDPLDVRADYRRQDRRVDRARTRVHLEML